MAHRRSLRHVYLVTSFFGVTFVSGEANVGFATEPSAHRRVHHETEDVQHNFQETHAGDHDVSEENVGRAESPDPHDRHWPSHPSLWSLPIRHSRATGAQVSSSASSVSTTPLHSCDVSLIFNATKSTVTNEVNFSCTNAWYNDCPCLDEDVHKRFFCSVEGSKACLPPDQFLVRWTVSQHIWIQLGWLLWLVAVSFLTFCIRKADWDDDPTGPIRYERHAWLMTNMFDLLWLRSRSGVYLETAISVYIVFAWIWHLFRTMGLEDSTHLDSSSVKAVASTIDLLNVGVCFVIILRYFGKLYACVMLPQLRYTCFTRLRFAITNRIMWYDILTVLPAFLAICGDTHVAVPSFFFFHFPRIAERLLTSRFGGVGVRTVKALVEKSGDVFYVPLLLIAMTWLVAATLKYLIEHDSPKLRWSADPGYGLYDSIPSSLYFTFIEFTGEFPDADDASIPFGRFVSMITCSIGAVLTEVPAGIISFSFRSLVREDLIEHQSLRPSLIRCGEVDSRHWLSSAAAKSVLLAATTVSIVLFIVSTYACQRVEEGVAELQVPAPGRWSLLILATCRYVDVTLIMPLFLTDWVLRCLYSPHPQTFLLSFRSFADIMSFLPSLLLLVSLLVHGSCVEAGLQAPVAKLQIGLHAFVAIRLIKLDRLFGRIFSKIVSIFVQYRQVFFVMYVMIITYWSMMSVAMYYCERNNPDPRVRKNFKTLFASLWMTALNLAGESPLNRYGPQGKALHACLIFFGILLYTVPTGIFSAAFRARFDKALAVESSNNFLSYSRSSVRAARTHNAHKGSSVMVLEHLAEDCVRDVHDACDFALMKLQSGTRRYWVHKLLLGSVHPSNACRRLAIAVELVIKIVTVIGVFASMLLTVKFFSDDCGSGQPQRFLRHVSISAEWCPGTRLTLMSIVDVCVIMYLIEFLTRWVCHPMKLKFVFSFAGISDLVSICPSLGHMMMRCLGVELAPSHVCVVTCLRMWRVGAFDRYTQSVKTVRGIICGRWHQLLQVLYVLLTCCVILTHLNWYFLHDSIQVDQGKAHMERYGGYLRAMQFTFLHMSGDYFMSGYPLGVCIYHCFFVFFFAWIVVAMPAGLLFGAFGDAMEARRVLLLERRLKATHKITQLFRRCLRLRRFHGVVNQARAMHEERRQRLLEKRAQQAHLVVLGRRIAGRRYRWTLGAFTAVYMVMVLLRSVNELREPEILWTAVMSPFVGVFSYHWIIRFCTSPLRTTARWPRLMFLCKCREIFLCCSIIAFATRAVEPTYMSNELFLATQMLFILQIEDVFHTRRIMSRLWTEMRSNIGSMVILGIIFWIQTSTLWFLSERTRIAELDSMPSTLYYTSIFLLGEWCVFDFGSVGAVLSILYTLIGVGIYALPMGATADALTSLIEASGTDFVFAKKIHDSVDNRSVRELGNEGGLRLDRDSGMAYSINSHNWDHELAQLDSSRARNGSLPHIWRLASTQ
eukprot:TRINITY_DN25476_c0_g3_i1.p1 TRINITY_DN25476_c0_g3~~TRINITY_DN25476_c0_g3_i1.p1  ORF type:complete len:1457 (-),score=120.37 TRINITY_DN25476_c0_g3_i1:138-4508(-)